MKEINSYGFNMAADDTREVRIEERLKIKIGEAKNLPARGHGAPSHRDTYCVLSLDQEEIFRTSTMERTLNPFFGEEFQFEVPRRFRYLSIYVFDRDKHLKQDKVLGKVAIKREDLQSYNNKDHWFALRPVDADSEVQGKAHIEIMFEDSKTSGEEYQKEVNFVYDYQESRTTEAVENEQQNMHTQYMRSSKQDLRIAEDFAGSMSAERKSKVKNFSKNISEYCKESMKFGSCSSSTSKKLLSAAGINDSSVGLSRSESLKNHYQSYQNYQGSHSYGPVSGQRGKCYMHTVPQGGQSPDSETSGMGSNESNHYSSDPERHYVNLEGSKPREVVDLKNKFSVRVLECSELTTKNGQCDPYALVTVMYANGKKVEKRTKVRKKTVNPRFDECFVFDLSMECDAKEREKDAYAMWVGSEACETRVSLWHEAAAPAFLGEVRVQMRAPRHPLSNDAWYFLTSRSASSRSRGATPPGTRLSAAGSASALGSLRLLLQYTVDRVFPLRAYDRLDALFMRSVQCKPITASAVYILGQIVSSKTDAAQPLVRLFTHHNLIVPVVRALADAEISALTDATTIFRGNTLVSKMMDECMRLSGAAYLRSVLRPTLAAVLADRRPCEIDPARVKERGAVEVNLANLKEYVEQVFAAITSSYGQCPPAMCRLFDALRQCAAKHFPRNAEVRYSVVSGFIFLRFFAPAILGPRLFDLTTEQIDPQTNRTLTLISKTIQSLGNLVSSRSAQQVCKEEYMAVLYRSFCTERHVQAIKRFLEIISTGSDTLNNNVQETPVLLKEGTMIKRTETGAWAGTGAAGGRRRWSRVAGAAGAAGGKRRHFRLTSGELSWSRSRGKLPLRKLALDGVVAVAAVDAPPGTAPLGAANIFQIVHRDRTLYVQAGNCVERAEWLRLLTALCRQRHHPGPFQNDKWICCGASPTETGGCESASEPAAAACALLALRLDPARDLQRLHCLLYAHLQQIEERLHEAARAGDATTEVKTLKELRETVFTLEHQHRVYQRSLARETKYGSKQAPIGDDNYLHLAATSAMALDGHQLPPFKPFQVAIVTSPLLARDTPALHHVSPAKSHREPAVNPNRITDFERKCKEQFHQKHAELPFDPATDANRNADFDHKCKTEPPRDTVIYENRLTDFERNEQFLKNSLYIGSSTESLKISGRNIDERLSGKSNKSGSGSSGYLKMSCLKNEHSEDSDTSGGKPTCPPRNANMKPALSENRLQVLPQQKPMCEYVDIKPKLPERQPKSKNVAKLSANLKQPSNEEIADNPQFYCKEYELMSNFMSCAAKQRQQMNEDVPPVVPPRSHHLNSNSPSNRRFSSNVENLKLLSDSKEKKPDMDGRRSSLREHKSMEQYQLKLVEDIDGSKGNNSTNATADSPISNSPPSLKEELRSQVKCDTEFEKSFTENALKESYCVLKVDSEDDKSVSRVQSQDKLVKEEVVEKIDEKKEEYGIFSRKSIQRKSNPIKSQNNSHKGLKSSSSTSNVKDICSQSKSSQLTERLTPFFFKKKTKPTDTAGQAPTKTTKKEDNLIGRLTPRFGQSRLYGRGQSLDLNVKCPDEKKGVERSATSVNIPVRPINSSIVGNLKFLSLHRPGAAENAVQCNKFVNRDSSNDMLDRNDNESGRDEPDRPVANANTDNVNSVNSNDGSDSEATSNDIIAENVADINYKNKVLEYVFENDVNFDKFSESIVILRDKHRVSGTEAARLSLTRSLERSDSQFIDNNLNISSATQPFLATSTSDIRL